MMQQNNVLVNVACKQICLNTGQNCCCYKKKIIRSSW